ncbi:MAG: protein tyrosine phosphatase [Alphaproteobacteria bacterium]|nr:protein tyrosine phosphatase [Alphaproteobacteria bacterium]
MARPFTREEFQTPAGRRRAWRALMLGDHGVLRLFYDNTHEVSAGKLWRSYQPSPARLARWKARGVRTIVNLRGDNPSGQYLLEEEACAKLGLRLVAFQVFSREPPSKEILYGARRLFEEIDYPAVMHCKSGADRAGLMSTLFLFLREGKPLDDAIGQLSFRYGHVRAGKTGVIDKFFDDYLAYAAAKGLDLSSADAFFDWVDREYDPETTKKTFLATWWGNLLVDRILNRE